MAQTSCPVLRPTAEEFVDFEAYIESIDELLVEHGVVKVVPPNGWYKPNYSWREWGLQLKAPILQLASGRAGVYHVDIVEAKSMSLEEFEARANQQSCDEDSYEKVERKFWKSLGIASVGEPPMYGADMMGSVFGEDCNSTWNLSNLPTILKLLGNDLPGVTNPMLYAGMWRAMFAFHVEDMDLYSINYLHFGAPKSWYSIPEEYAERFETLANSYFPELYQDCKEYLRHKVVMISPSKLKEHGIPYRTVVQEAGEFVVTSPRAYHAGYNHGFNLAEATNFATERWIEYGRTARVCKCRPFCVSIDMDYFETKYRRMRKQKALGSKIEAEPTDGSLSGDDIPPPWQVQGWEFACACGLKCTHEDHPSKHPIGEQYECAMCGIWCHVACVYGEGSNLESIPDAARCAICMNIDGLEKDRRRHKSHRRPARAPSAGTAPQVVAEDERPGKKRPRRRAPKSAFQKKSDVYVHFIDGSWEPGTIALVEDGAAKVILQKPRKGRDREQWVSLQSSSLVLKEDFEVEQELETSLPNLGKGGIHSTSSSSRAERANRRRRNSEPGQPAGVTSSTQLQASAAAQVPLPASQPTSLPTSQPTARPSHTPIAPATLQPAEMALLDLLCKALVSNNADRQLVPLPLVARSEPVIDNRMLQQLQMHLQDADGMRRLTCMLLNTPRPQPIRRFPAAHNAQSASGDQPATGAADNSTSRESPPKTTNIT